MKPEDFISLESGMPIAHRWVIVSNNIEAKNGFGEMSHVWLTNHVQLSRYENDGFMTYDEHDMTITRLTHYKYA